MLSSLYYDGGLCYWCAYLLIVKLALQEQLQFNTGHKGRWRMITNEMLNQKIDALVAAEKLRVNQDPIYHVLADITHILNAAYKMAGVNRPIPQIQSESMDIMLECLSSDQKDISSAFFKCRLSADVKKYRPLPKSFMDDVDRLLANRREKVQQMTAEERAEEAFSAYLGSINTTEEMVRTSMEGFAKDMVEQDIRLDAVIQEKGIDVSEEELEKAYMQLAMQCDVPIEAVKEQLSPLSLSWQLKRDKARSFEAESA